LQGLVEAVQVDLQPEFLQQGVDEQERGPLVPPLGHRDQVLAVLVLLPEIGVGLQKVLEVVPPEGLVEVGVRSVSEVVEESR